MPLEAATHTLIAEECFVYLLSPPFLELLELVLLGRWCLVDILHAGLTGTPPLLAGVHQDSQLLLHNAFSRIPA